MMPVIGMIFLFSFCCLMSIQFSVVSLSCCWWCGGAGGDIPTCRLLIEFELYVTFQHVANNNEARLETSHIWLKSFPKKKKNLQKDVCSKCNIKYLMLLVCTYRLQQQ